MKKIVKSKSKPTAKLGAKKSISAKNSEKKKIKLKTSPVWVLKVESSNIKEATYNVDSEQLFITFHSGKLYRYSKVSVKEFKRFTLAPSQGVFLNEVIKPNKKVKEVEIIEM